MKKIIIVLVFLLSIGNITFSQSNKHIRVLDAKVEYVVNYISLNDEEKKDFSPLYREFCIKKISAKKKLRSSIKSVKTDNLTASPDDILISEQAILDLEKDYMSRFKKIIPEDKVARIFIAEKEFRSLLIKKMKEKKRSAGK